VLRSATVMRRLATTLALTLFLLGCGSVPPPPPPSGEPIYLPVHGTENYCEGRADSPGGMSAWLRADADVFDPIMNTSNRTVTALELLTPQPSGVGYPAQVFIAASWPSEYKGVRLADGEIAVLDGAGSLVATTGRKYRVDGLSISVAPVGGPLFGKEFSWIGAFIVCGVADL